MKKLTVLIFMGLNSLLLQAQLKPMFKVMDQMQKPKDTSRQLDSLPVLLKVQPTSIQPMDGVKRYLLTMPYVIDSGNAIKDRLVSDYAFRKLIRSDFTKTILGMDNVSKINRYASLDLSDKPAFDFTPLAWSDDPENKVFANIFSVNISGKMNSDGFVDMKKLRDLTLKFNVVHIFSWSNYKPVERISALKGQMYCDSHKEIEDLCDKYQQKLNDLYSGACGGTSDNEAKRKEIIKSFKEEFSELEITTAEPYWKVKVYYWLSGNLGIKRDKVDFVNQDDLDQNKYNVTHETLFSPEALASFNTLRLYSTGASVLSSIWMGVKQKHSLSEVFSPDDFQPYYQVDATTLQLKDKESVFVTDFNTIQQKIKADIGARFVMLSRCTKNRKQQIGLSLAGSRKGLVHESSSALYRFEAGAVFPFLKEDGSSKFNLEFFRRWDEYSHFPNDNESTWGFRFNVPITN